MKRLGIALVSLLILASLGLTSCQEDDGPSTQPPVSDSVEIDGTIADLPPSTNLTGMRVLCGFDSTSVSSTGTFRVPVSRTVSKAVLLIDQEGALRHVTFFPARISSPCEMSAKETAVSLIMMNPLLMPDSPELALEFRQLIEGRTAFTDFKTTLSQRLQSGYKLGDPDTEVSDKLSAVYDDLYRVLHEELLNRRALDDLGPLNGLTLHTVGDDPSNLQFQILNGASRWVGIWGTTHSSTGGFSAAEKFDLLPAPNVSILERILHAGTTETAQSGTLSLPKTGKDFAKIDCYGLGVDPNLSQADFDRVLEPSLYTVVFDFSLPIASLLAGTNLELQGSPSQHPFKQIVDLVPQENPNLSADLYQAMVEQDAPAVFTDLVRSYVLTIANNPTVFADATRQVIMAANGGTMPRHLVKMWLFPNRLVATALTATNLSWLFASTLTNDVVTTFRYDIVSAPAYDATVEGRVLDASTDTGLAGVDVAIATAEGLPIAIVTTNTQGDYSAEVPSGNLVIDYTKTGYFAARQTAQVDPSGTTTLPPVWLASHADARGTVGGKVIDAQTGFGLPGATVRLVAGLDPEAAGEVATATTDGEGNYQFALMRPGSYTAIASKQEYISQYIYLAVVGGVTRLDFDITLSLPVAGEGYRFVLTWGEEPGDLDSHLLTPLIQGSTYEIRWNNRGQLESPPYASLDVDDQSSYGPETVTIAQNFEGSYTYAVYQWSSTGSLPASQARVVLYSGDQQVRQWTVPSSGSGRWWYVCDLNAIQGVIENVNRLQDDPPAGMSPSLRGVQVKPAAEGPEE